MKIGKRIRELLREKGMNQSKLAQKAGLTQAAISQFISNAANPSLETIARIASALDTTPGDILGDITPEEMGTPPVKIAETIRVKIFPDVLLSAGHGAINEDNPHEFIQMEKRAIIEEIGLNPDHLNIGKVKGDSMSPEITDGDYVVIDKNRRIFESDGLYAVCFSGHGFVKRLQMNPGKSIRLISTNKIYPDIVIDVDNEGDFKIIGKIVGIINLKKA